MTLAFITALMSLGSSLQPTNVPVVSSFVSGTVSITNSVMQEDYDYTYTYVSTNTTFYGLGFTNNGGAPLLETYVNPANNVGYQLAIPGTNSALTFTSNFSFIAGTLSSNINASTAAYFTANTNPTTQWALYSGDGWNTNCWINPTNFGGYVRKDWHDGNSPISIITPMNGVIAQHIDSGGCAGSTFHALGTDGLFHTNGVAADVWVADDLRVVTFSNAFPATVVPFSLLPTNFMHYTSMTNVIAVWIRNNTWKLNTVLWQGLSPGDNEQFSFGGSVTNSNFNDSNATGGDSGGPVFCVAGNQVALLNTIYSSLTGPGISLPGVWPSVQAALGTNTPNFVSVTNFISF